MIIVPSTHPVGDLGWTVEVDADPSTVGVFVIGSSLLGGPDLLAASPRWVDVGQDVVRSISIRRGRADDSRPYDAGEAVVVFDNRTGDFDPDNPYGHYVMGPLRLLNVGTGVRIRFSGGTVFQGHVEEPTLSDDPFVPTATYTCVDDLAKLGQVEVPSQGSQTGEGESSSSRANWLLDQAGMPTSVRSVDAYGRQMLGTTGGGTVRTALQRVADGEAGRLFVNREGVVTLTWHDTEYGKTSEVDFTDTGVPVQYMGMQVSPGVSGVVNRATVHRIPPRERDVATGQFVDSPEIPDVVAQDNDSAALYGVRNVTINCDLLDDGEAESLATFVAGRRSQPTKRLTQIVTRPLETYSVTNATRILGLDLGSLVTLSRQTFDGRGLYFQAVVEGIRVDSVPGATKVTLSTVPADTNQLFGSPGWFIIGASVLGGTDVLAPY